jgi:hypothetical protein
MKISKNEICLRSTISASRGSCSQAGFKVMLDSAPPTAGQPGLLSAAPYQVSYDVDPGLEMSGAYRLSAADLVGNGILSSQFRLVKDSTAPQAAVYVPAQPALAFRVNWQGQDSQAGVAYYGKV